MMDCFDFSMMDCYLVCQKRFYWRHIKDLTTNARQTPLEFGHAIHEGLNQWFKTSSVDSMLKAFRKDWETAGGDCQEDIKRTLEKGKRILKGYVVKYQQEPFTVVANEKSFELAMPNGLTYIGRCDRVVDWQGAIYVLEHKTMSQMGYATFNRFKPNLQVDGYIYATRQEYPKCHGCVMDALLVAKTKEDYARKIETRTEDEIAQFPKLFNLVTSDILESVARERYVPNYSMCTYYGECPYRTLCMQSPELRERIAQTEYKVSRWDPRDREEDT